MRPFYLKMGTFLHKMNFLCDLIEKKIVQVIFWKILKHQNCASYYFILYYLGDSLMWSNTYFSHSNSSHISAVAKDVWEFLRQNGSLLLITQSSRKLIQGQDDMFYKIIYFWLCKCWWSILSPTLLGSVISVFAELVRSTVRRLSHHPVVRTAWIERKYSKE